MDLIINKPLIKNKIYNNNYIISYNNENLFNIIINNNENIEINCLSNINLISPVLEHPYKINFREDKDKDFLIIFNKIIIELNNFIYIIEFDFKNDFILKKEIINNLVSIKLISNNINKLIFQQFNNLTNYYQSIKIKDLLFYYRIYFCIELNNFFSKNINLNNITNQFLSDNIMFITDNFDVSTLEQNSIIFDKFKLINQKIIIKINNKIKNIKEDLKVLMTNKGTNYIDNNNQYYLDFISEKGENQLKKIYKEILDNKIGIYLNSIIYKINKDFDNKILCKVNNIYDDYYDNIKLSFKKLNSIINNQYCNNLIFGNILSNDLNNIIFIYKIDTNNILIEFQKIEQIIIQGFINLGLYFTNIKFDNNTLNFLLFIILPFIIIYDEKILFNLNNNLIIKNIFYNLIKFKKKLKIFYDNLIINLIKSGNRFYKINNYDNFLVLFLTEYFYISYPAKKMQTNSIYIPESKWICLNNNLIYDSGFYYINDIDFNIYFFQKINSILVLIPDRYIDNLIEPEKIQFNIFVNGDFEQDIFEYYKNNKVINHKFIIKKINNYFEIDYSNEIDHIDNEKSLVRIIIINFITDKKVNKLYINNNYTYYKKINDYNIEFEFKNNNLATNIKIYIY